MEVGKLYNGSKTYTKPNVLFKINNHKELEIFSIDFEFA